MAPKRFLLLSRLRKAIQKVKLLLSFNATKWMLSSIMASSPGPRQLSFKAQPSLLDCTVDSDYYELGSSFGPSRTTSSVISRSTSSASEITRSLSDNLSGDDIDKKAEMFIANFYRHIQMERQVSLELRYCKEGSLERTLSD
ncbi:uncharacterized protein [Typha angustifolia]|uniref:uncharacterized protein n=1 Tax=Typha angustifolia TaxID=59011 RepID=UPI003C2EA0D0